MRGLILLLPIVIACSTDGASPTVNRAPWTSWVPGQIIGDTLGASATTIGSVAGTAISARSELLILDGSELTLLAFDSSGNLVARAAGGGDGPGELRDPVALALIGRDTVVLVDRGQRRISVLSPVASGMQFVRSVPLTFHPGAACAMGADLFVLGSQGAMYLHRFANTDTAQLAYSPLTPGPNESSDEVAAARRFELGGGELLCAAHEGVVIHAPEIRGEVFGIRRTGELAWTHSIDGFIPPVHTPRPAGIRMDLNPAFNYADRVANATLIGGGLVQLVVRRSFARDANREPELWSEVIRVADGARVWRGDSPPLFGATTETLAAEHLEAPTPAVRVWRKTGR
jgi:hypothetical protein